MKKILRILFNRNTLMLCIINLLLADTAIFSLILLFMTAISREELIWAGYALIIIIARLFILPVFYNWFKNIAKDKYIQDFLYKLRYSRKTKLLVLFLSPIPFIIEIYLLSNGYTTILKELLREIATLYIYSLFCGLLGSYVVLFIYWFIEDKIKSFKKSVTEPQP